MVYGRAVLEAVRPAAVFCDVSSDGAGDLAGRVGSIKETRISDPAGNLHVDHAGLYYRRAGLGVYFEDPFHAGRFYDHSTARRSRAPAQSRAGASRGKRHPVTPGELDQPGDLVCSFREDHKIRQRAVMGEAVAFVCQQLIGVVQNTIGPGNLFQFAEDLRLRLGLHKLQITHSHDPFSTPAARIAQLEKPCHELLERAASA